MKNRSQKISSTEFQIHRKLYSNATSGGILDKAIEAEHRKHGDFMRLDHIEGYLELSAKTRSYFATAVSMWDADFYIKVDDDVHVNIGTLGDCSYCLHISLFSNMKV
ncbi:hypothetical protein B296_00055825 [Ensete ventricosum]|uniref:Hexosyltransferase n=1 Tax=Ensete ventricosum TaxID=4639 RepID=A0A426XBF0_ENSVE|nr:hypothetical protein B296_00055825 [Ensete ventricosum]